jgi:hypothetical protein
MDIVLRGGPWQALLGLAAAGAALGVLGLEIDHPRSAHLGCVLIGCAAAFALDEPAAEVVAACPRSRRSRSAGRIATALGLTTAIGVLWSALGASAALLLALLGCAVLALAAAAATRAVRAEPGEPVAVALLLALVTAMLFEPIGKHLMLFPLGPASDRSFAAWWTLIAVALVSLLVTSSEHDWRPPPRIRRTSP